MHGFWPAKLGVAMTVQIIKCLISSCLQMLTCCTAMWHFLDWAEQGSLFGQFMEEVCILRRAPQWIVVCNEIEPILVSTVYVFQYSSLANAIPLNHYRHIMQLSRVASVPDNNLG